MEPATHGEVFGFLVRHRCRRAAAGLWLDLFERLLRHDDLAAPDAAGSGGETAKAIVASPVGEELQQCFEWLTAVAFHRTEQTAKVIDAETAAMASDIRDDITRDCVKMLNQRNPSREWPGVHRELLMTLWGDGYGNLVSRAIQREREVSGGDDDDESEPIRR